MLRDRLRSKPAQPVMLAVWLNFVDNGRHGCSKACDFCNFRKHPIYMCPTEEGLKEYIRDYMPYSRRPSLLLSGGGDPLYEFEKNREQVLMILRVCKELGVATIMQSYELDTIDRYCETLFKNIETYYFSVEGEDERLLRLIKKLTSLGKKVSITRVLNSTSDMADLNLEKLDPWVAYYSMEGVTLHVRENYNHCYTDDENEAIRYAIVERYIDNPAYNVHYRPHKNVLGRFIGLMNDEVLYGEDFITLRFLADRPESR